MIMLGIKQLNMNTQVTNMYFSVKYVLLHLHAGRKNLLNTIHIKVYQCMTDTQDTT